MAAPPSRFGPAGRSLDGKVAIVTGSTGAGAVGVGAAIARLFAAQGAAVAIVGRDAEAGERVRADIEREGGQAIVLRTDVTVEDDVKAMVASTLERYGRVDILVNNAYTSALSRPGFGVDAPVEDLETEAWEQILRVGITSVFWCCKYTIPAMTAAGGGAILNISSGASLYGVPGLDAYATAKGGMNSLTRAVAAQYGPRNIRANCLVLGGVLPAGLFAQLSEGDGAAAAGFADLPLGRPGEPEDIAYAARFLCSDEAAWITGVVMSIDGGGTARYPSRSRQPTPPPAD